MFVGVLRLVFHIPHARSLKDKRAVTRRFRDRTRARFEVSVAEVGAQDLLQKAVFGVSVISGDAKVCASVLEQVARSASLQEECVLTDRATEIVPFGDEMFGFGDAGGELDAAGDEDGFDEDDEAKDASRGDDGDGQ